jgi:hypothetical protein
VQVVKSDRIEGKGIVRLENLDQEVAKLFGTVDNSRNRPNLLVRFATVDQPADVERIIRLAVSFGLSRPNRPPLRTAKRLKDRNGIDGPVVLF